MAQLYRVTNYRDSQKTFTFTFVLPTVVLQDGGHQDILSREFAYAGHRWRVVLCRKNGQHLSPYLELCNSQTGMCCVVDYSFSLLNRDSYTQNERYCERQARFGDGGEDDTARCERRRGLREFLPLADVHSRIGFVDNRHEVLLDLTLRSPASFYRTRLQIIECESGQYDYRRYDTERFKYGDTEWSAVFCPNMETDSRPRHMVQIKRLGRNDTLCKLRYRVTLGDRRGTVGKFYQSVIKEELFDFSGSTEGVSFYENYLGYVSQGKLDVQIEFFSVNQISRVKVPILTPTALNAKQSENDRLSPAIKMSGQAIDQDRQKWKLVANSNGTCLKVALYYTDLNNVPLGYMRYVSWTCRIIGADESNRAPIQFGGCPLENYYTAQMIVDARYFMASPLPIDEIFTPKSGWLDRYEQKITIEIDWLASYLLSLPMYTTNDDISKRHLLQMSREIEVLQSENFSLERQLRVYKDATVASGSVDQPGTLTKGDIVRLQVTQLLSPSQQQQASTPTSPMPPPENNGGGGFFLRRNGSTHLKRGGEDSRRASTHDSRKENSSRRSFLSAKLSPRRASVAIVQTDYDLEIAKKGKTKNGKRKEGENKTKMTRSNSGSQTGVVTSPPTPKLNGGGGSRFLTADLESSVASSTLGVPITNRARRHSATTLVGLTKDRGGDEEDFFDAAASLSSRRATDRPGDNFQSFNNTPYHFYHHPSSMQFFSDNALTARPKMKDSKDGRVSPRHSSSSYRLGPDSDAGYESSGKNRRGSSNH